MIPPKDTPKEPKKATQKAAKGQKVVAKVAESARLKEDFLNAFLKQVPAHGWSEKALFEAAKVLKQPEAMALALFVQKEKEVLEVWSRALDEAMVAKLQKLDLEKMKIRERIFWAVRVRLSLLEAHKEAANAAFSFLCYPLNVPCVPPLLYETTHHMWVAAGDTSTDYNFYTKRLLLAGVYVATFLYWLKDTSPEHHKTWKFLESRIENVLWLQKAKAINPLEALKTLKDSPLKDLPFLKMMQHFWPFSGKP